MKNWLGLKTNKLTCAIVILCIVLLAVSYVLYIANCSGAFLWLSNALIGISGGIIAGYVIYMLTNIRYSEKEEIEVEFKAMCSLRQSIIKINMAIKKCHSLYADEDSDCIDEMNEVFVCYSDVIEKMMDLPYSLFVSYELDDNRWTDMVDKEYTNYELFSKEDEDLFIRVNELENIVNVLREKTDSKYLELSDKRKALRKYSF